MEESTIKKYLEEDFKQALRFYDRRAKSNKLAYRVFSIYLIVAAAVLTPLVALASHELFWRILTASFSATIVIGTGLLALVKPHENWLSYRASWDAFMRERRLFGTSSGPYHGVSDKSVLFVERVESVLSREASDFFLRHTKEGSNNTKSG